ncbi:MAG: hypothetical protein KGY68_04165 [Candidatus Thermoplasmatota archaeon]|nr:hypothetical protein [Candidatus Thermoplasmatota archaeon]
MKLRKYLIMGIVTLMLVGICSISLGSPEITERTKDVEGLSESSDNNQYNLTIEEPVGNGTVKVDGKVVELPYKKKYSNGSKVNLTATPDEDWEFMHWGGPSAVGFGKKRRNENITIEINEDKEFLVYFFKVEYVEIYMEENDSTTVDKINITAGDEINFTAQAFGRAYNLSNYSIEDIYTDFTWENTTAEGLFDNTTAGDYEITATYDGVTSQIVLVTVEPAGVDSVDITPSEDQNLTAGDTIDFDAETYDQYSNLITDVDTEFDWKNTTAKGVFDNTTSGDYAVTATYEGVSSQIVVVTVEPAGVDSVEITPPEDQTITAGETVDFNAEAYDQYGNLEDDVDTNFTWENTTAEGVFDNTTAGDYEVTVTFGDVSSKIVLVKVEPAGVDSVEITPSEDQTITAGDMIDFSAEAYDEYDNLITDDDTDFTWQSMDDEGSFTETTAGDYEVTATYGDLTSEIVTVTVEAAAVNYVEITPDTDQTITAGDTIDFDAETYDQYDNMITDADTDFTWVNTTAEGVFDNTTAGDYEVTATYDDVASQIVVTVEPAGVNSVELTPSQNQIITAGEEVNFSAEAFDEYGNSITDVDTDFTWNNNTDEYGLFDNTTAGDYKINATYEGVTFDTLMVTVEPSEVDYVKIYPDEDQKIDAGETIEFSAEAYDEYGNLITEDDIEFNWKNTDDSGLFDITEAGEHEVTATYENVTSDPVTVDIASTINPAIIISSVAFTGIVGYALFKEFEVMG